MKAINLDTAAHELAAAVVELPYEDVVEVYNELFPRDPAAGKPVRDVGPLVSEIVEYLHDQPEPEEVVDLWNVVFPEARDVHYDEEDQLLHFIEAA